MLTSTQSAYGLSLPDRCQIARNAAATRRPPTMAARGLAASSERPTKSR